MFDRDLEAAGIKMRTEAGKVDFYARRVAHATLVVEAGVALGPQRILGALNRRTATVLEPVSEAPVVLAPLSRDR